MQVITINNNPELFKKACRLIFDSTVLPVRPNVDWDKWFTAISARFQNKFPTIWALLSDDGELIGTINMIEDDLGNGTTLSPWLGGFAIKPAYRGRKIGGVLIEAVKAKAKENGYSKLYLRTETTSAYYKHLGWSFVEKAIDKHGTATEVYSIEI